MILTAGDFRRYYIMLTKQQVACIIVAVIKLMCQQNYTERGFA